MAEFSIKGNSTQASVTEMNGIKQEVAKVEQEIQRVLSDLRGFSGSFDGVQRRLKNQLGKVTDERQKVIILSDALKEIIATYERAEKNILNAGHADRRIREAFQNAIQQIRDISEQYGVDLCCAYGGDPVNLSNGNFIYDKSCIRLNSDTDLEFKIFYNAHLNKAGTMGKGWTHSYSLYLTKEESKISVYMEDASTLNFIRVEEDFVALPNTNAAISVKKDGYIVTTKDQTSYLFDSDGRFLGKKTVSGGEAVISYDMQGLMTAVKDGVMELAFEYDAENKIVSVSDKMGRSIGFTYQGDLLCSVNGINGSDTCFAYNNNDLLENVVDANGQVILSNTYDAEKRVIEQKFYDGGVIRYDYEARMDGSRVTVTEQNGNKIVYEHDDLRRNTGIIYANGEEKFEFNDQNLRTSFEDRNGNVSRYQYDDRGNIIRFINACGHTLDLSYTSENQVESVSMNQELIHKACYNEKGLQVLLENAIGAKESFEYNEKNLPVKWTKADGSIIYMEYDERGNLISISNSMGGVTKYEYDAWNRTVKSIDAYGNPTYYEYNTSDEITAVTDSCGNKWIYEYDHAGNMTSITDPGGAKTIIRYNPMNKPVEIADACGGVTYMEYNTMSDIVKEIGPDGGVLSFEYDQFRNLTKVTDANGNTNTMTYDACGNMISRTDANGNLHQLSYDALNRPVEVTTPVGMKVKGEYDAFGNVVAVYYEDGTSEECTYDLTGNLLTYKDQNGYVKKMKYNVSGDLTEVSDDAGIISTYEYYAGGLLKKEKNVDGSSTEFFYDKNENVIKAVQADQNIWEFAYDPLERISQVVRNDVIVEKYEYDANGNITAVIDAQDNRTEYTYNPLGKLVKVRDALGFETAYRYDACQRLIQILQSKEGVIDPKGLNEFNQCQKGLKVTTYAYDRVGNVISAINPNGGKIEFQYDGCGNVISKKDEEGNITTCDYDADGKERLIKFANGKTIKYQYDALRRLSQLEDWFGITKIESDAAGRVTSITKPEGESVRYEWLPDGRKSAIEYPNGEKIHYGYDDQRHLSYISNGRQKTQYRYSENGKLKQKLLPNNVCIDYKYGANGDLAELSHKHNQTIINKFIYEYDENGRKCAKYVKSVEGEDSYRYAYNGVGSLNQVSRNGQVIEEYQYDGFGNRIWERVNGVETQYEYDADDCLISEKNVKGVKEYFYDLRGNMKEERLNGQSVYSYEFDELNLLSKIHAETGSLMYQYDGFGNRVEETYADAEGKSRKRQYVFDALKISDHLLSYKNDCGISQNVWWDDANSVISAEDGIYSLVHDELMSPYSVINAEGLQMACTYGTFGESKYAVAKFDSPFSYTGYQSNRMISNRLFANKREYDSRTGRFISKDMIGGDISTPITINPFLYCLCDPVNFYDPTGMVIAWLAGGIVGAVANVAVKAAGDVVNSVKNGKPTFSSWQSYVGTATGGFVEGSVLVATGSPALAGAAGGATEALVTGGLSMATGAEGYRKEDGYSWKNLLGDTAVGGVTGLASGFVFGNAAKYVKIPGITKGRGSYQAVWKQVVTKAQKGIIKNISWKTIGKAIVAYGGVKFLDTIIKKGIDEVKEYAKEKAFQMGKYIYEKGKTKIENQVTAKALLAKNLMPSCSATGSSAV